ncbi:unnamed protein product [Moneuplotes crassus]|uniref:Uncharacterized protein n=1 Tax=Euplotes crassus TaxID=5936 RepID=A0AAD1UMN5_EUPCR|nr:unnamed protein product [Moneuplotes crassus]
MSGSPVSEFRKASNYKSCITKDHQKDFLETTFKNYEKLEFTLNPYFSAKNEIEDEHNNCKDSILSTENEKSLRRIKLLHSILNDEQTNDGSLCHITNLSEKEEPIHDTDIFKGSRPVNLVTDGSENINEESDVCLGGTNAEVKYKKKVSFVTDLIQQTKEGDPEMESFSLRPQSTLSHMSIAEEYVVESRCTALISRESNNKGFNIHDVSDKENQGHFNANNWAGSKDLNQTLTPGENCTLKDCIDYISFATNASRLENTNNYSEINMSTIKSKSSSVTRTKRFAPARLPLATKKCNFIHSKAKFPPPSTHPCQNLNLNLTQIPGSKLQECLCSIKPILDFSRQNDITLKITL